MESPLSVQHLRASSLRSPTQICSPPTPPPQSPSSPSSSQGALSLGGRQQVRGSARRSKLDQRHLGPGGPGLQLEAGGGSGRCRKMNWCRESRGAGERRSAGLAGSQPDWDQASIEEPLARGFLRLGAGSYRGWLLPPLHLSLSHTCTLSLDRRLLFITFGPGRPTQSLEPRAWNPGPGTQGPTVGWIFSVAGRGEVAQSPQ